MFIFIIILVVLMSIVITMNRARYFGNALKSTLATPEEFRAESVKLVQTKRTWKQMIFIGAGLIFFGVIFLIPNGDSSSVWYAIGLLVFGAFMFGAGSYKLANHEKATIKYAEQASKWSTEKIKASQRTFGIMVIAIMIAQLFSPQRIEPAKGFSFVFVALIILWVLYKLQLNYLNKRKTGSR